MGNPILVGLGLGLTAAVAFASATGGPFLMRFILFFITPLPIALAGLGWGVRTAAIAGFTGTALVALVAGPPAGLVFAVSQALPVILLAYLALLSRTGASPDGRVTVEWYPIGRLVVWAALLAGLLAIATLALIGGDIDELRKNLVTYVEEVLTKSFPQTEGSPRVSDTEIKALAEVALGLLPAASAVSWMASILFNLWLGGRVTLASGQLARPWPDLALITYPRGTSLAFAAALAASLAGGYVGLAASGMAGALFFAYVLLGLAVIHYSSRGRSWRPFALWILYAALILSNIWFAVVLALLGLAEAMLALRSRYPPLAAPPSGPPTI